MACSHKCLIVGCFTAFDHDSFNIILCICLSSCSKWKVEVKEQTWSIKCRQYTWLLFLFSRWPGTFKSRNTRARNRTVQTTFHPNTRGRWRLLRKQLLSVYFNQIFFRLVWCIVFIVTFVPFIAGFKRTTVNWLISILRFLLLFLCLFLTLSQFLNVMWVWMSLWFLVVNVSGPALKNTKNQFWIWNTPHTFNWEAALDSLSEEGVVC